MLKLLSQIPRKFIKFILVFSSLAFFYFVLIEWKGIRLSSKSYITVSGSYTQQETNNVAGFNVSVFSTKDAKEDAVKDANTKMAGIIEKVKSFGVDAKDMKTDSSIYQNEDYYYENGSQKSRMGQWRATSNLNITLREVEKADALSQLLSSLEVSSMYGPNFYKEDSAENDAAALNKAMDNAIEKAQTIAKGQSRKLGKILAITEGYNNQGYKVFEGYGGGGAEGLGLPGTTSETKTLSVTFELK